ELNGTLYFKETHLPEMLKLGRCTVPVEVKTAMMIDSLEMTEQQRKIIIEMCNRCEQNKIIITHGTDTMAVTAKVLGEAGLSKTIVLTGAMIPYKFGSSDGFFNLGSAFAFAQALPHGVYIAMNGRYFDWHNVLKNKKTGIFEEL
ncbi:MAG: asparaginase domain-containing protein, partial [Chitinophagales bacterium]